jgi:heterodisulfide reductase subunit A-like polyferredoxin
LTTAVPKGIFKPFCKLRINRNINYDFYQEIETMSKDVKGSVMVVGGGIAGMQSALDLANSGYYVYLLEKSPSIGGVMSQLDKTFPTNDCAM